LSRCTPSGTFSLFLSRLNWFLSSFLSLPRRDWINCWLPPHSLFFYPRLSFGMLHFRVFVLFFFLLPCFSIAPVEGGRRGANLWIPFFSSLSLGTITFLPPHVTLPPSSLETFSGRFFSTVRGSDLCRRHFPHSTYFLLLYLVGAVAAFWKRR